MSAALRADVVVVSYNTREHLRTCLESVLRDDPGTVIVVDNGSSDGSVEMVQSQFPSVQLIFDPRNRGYGAAANLGFAASTTECVVLLNSDTVLSPGTLASLSAYLHEHAQVGIVGPRLRNLDGTLQRSCFPFPSPLTAFLGETHLGYLIRFVPVLRARHPRTWPHNEPREMPWILGAALAIRRAAFEQIGGFDEAFFMYAEEIDLCYRMQRRGWKIHYAPVADVVHFGGASTSRYRSAMRVQFYASIARFYHLYRGPAELRTMRTIVQARALVRLVGTLARVPIARLTGNRDRVAEDLQACRELVSGRWASPQND
jgi:N-acetylglucosaminyl-diphospho-decaprenol L-rhamnosyltransferase